LNQLFEKLKVNIYPVNLFGKLQHHKMSLASCSYNTSRQVWCVFLN